MPEPFIQSLVLDINDGPGHAVPLAGPECLVETYRETYQREEKPTFLALSALARFGSGRQAMMVQP